MNFCAVRRTRRSTIHVLDGAALREGAARVVECNLRQAEVSQLHVTHAIQEHLYEDAMHYIAQCTTLY